jgi:polyferredoxin
MKITTTRRISQTIFFSMFLWFCIASVLGEKYWQLRAWPVNLFLNLDPLVAIGTIITTHKLFAPLLWGMLTIILTLIFGRFFCSWVCPFGTLHHFVGFLAHRKTPAAKKIKLNTYRPAQSIKYFVLIFFIGMTIFKRNDSSTLQTGLLDPIPLITRSFNIVLLPVIETLTKTISAVPRKYEGGLPILAVFLTFVFLNLFIPRFFCRFVCPTGALFGIINRFSFFRIGKNVATCSDCKLCEKTCQGACAPSAKIRSSECLLCMNCLDDCKDDVITYRPAPSSAGEVSAPDISRRGFMLSISSGILAIPAIRMAGKLGNNWNHLMIRPPGSLTETEFLKRCIKCGQCIRICPTNVLQPAGINTGLESLWTPILNNRIGTSGCQLNCTACGNICPTSAIRSISLDEKLGTGDFADVGPIKLGTAFVDRSRCLPWAMDKPCIVCQENCPVSPKAIFTKEVFNTIRNGTVTVKKTSGKTVSIVDGALPADAYAGGDYYLSPADAKSRLKITANSVDSIELEKDIAFKPGNVLFVQVRLQQPHVDIEKCTGCGVCQHECPVSGKRAIRVSGDGETRSNDRKLLLD